MIATETLPLQDQLKIWNNAKEFTKELAQLMPEDKYEFTPAPEARSFGELMNHLAWSNSAMIGMSTSGKMPFEKPTRNDKQTVLNTIEDSFGYCIRTLEGLTPEQLSATVQGTSVQIFIWRAVAHTIHHRGQATVYLRLNGIKPPTYRF